MKRTISWLNIVDFKMTENGPKVKYSDRHYKTFFAETVEELDNMMEDFLNINAKMTGYDIDDITWEDKEC